MKKLLLISILFTLFPLSVYAIEDTTVRDLFSQSEVNAQEIEELDKIEENRVKGFENQLGFTLPQYTDNPSYVITFVDPSPDANGVQIDIDGKGFNNITSPYTLPALGIGQHTLKFRFNDKDGNVQLLEYDFIVIPRSPIIAPPTFNDSSITVKGSGLSNSDILIFLNSNTFNHKDVVQTDSNGDWSITVTPESSLVEGIYSVTAYTRKYGYASEFSDPTVFEVGSSNKEKSDKDTPPIFFSFASIKIEDSIEILRSNPDLIVLIALPFLLGISLALILRSIARKNKEDSVYKRVEGAIKSDKKEDSGPTLRELFEGKNTPKQTDVESVKKEEPVKEKEEKEVKTDKVVSKEEFLKEYKDVDPDDNSGKEKKLPKIKISLTSREE
ncbi:MAG: hypothetical protein RBT33_01660 [Candidatus Dojkabacteria bacterium]|jgi:hypothetical protein|nr:hypothetical protein [Candidatus Dojkabacteria bacterium]